MLRILTTIKNKQQGFATFEMLIAMTIIIMSISSVLLLVSGGQSASIGSETNQEALYKAQQQVENARAMAYANFSDPSLNAGTTTTYDTNILTYKKDLTVSDIDSFTKKITSDVTWGTNQHIALSTIVANWQPILSGDTCNPTLSGDWTHPQLLGSADVGQNNGGTDVDVFAKKAYVTADASSASKPDFYIVDVSDPNVSNLPILGSINTGPGLAAVKFSNNYAYVANISTVSQLQIINTSVPASPTLTSSFKVTPPGDTAVGNSIFYLNKRVYLGLTKSTGPEFYVIDVSDPANLVIKASFEINSQVNKIIVKNNIAYLTVPDNTATSGVSEQLRILDVSQADSGTITELNPFGPNPSTMSGEGLYISKDGKTLYLGQGGANPGNKPEFFSLNITDPNNINQIKSKYIPTSNNITVNAITIRSNLAFLWTSDPGLGFQIWDLNNLSSSTPYASLNTQQTATGGLDCDGNLIYTAQRSQKALQIIGPAADSYSLSNNGDITVKQGSSGNNTITRTLVSGNPPADALTVSGLPTGAAATWTNNPCSATCSSQLTINTAPTTPVGTYVITVNGYSGTTTTFNLVVNSSFDYSITNSNSLSITRGGPAVTFTVTVTITAGVPQLVTLTPPNPKSSQITVTPSSGSCTPSASVPYSCTVDFTYQANSTGAAKSYTGQIVTGSPNAKTGTPFTVTVN